MDVDGAFQHHGVLADRGVHQFVTGEARPAWRINTSSNRNSVGVTGSSSPLNNTR